MFGQSKTSPELKGLKGSSTEVQAAIESLEQTARIAEQEALKRILAEEEAKKLANKQ